MKIVYLSLTGKTRQFVQKIGWDFIEISKKNPVNSNFNTTVCTNAKVIASKYNIPLLHLFENQGTEKDLQILKEKVREIG